MVNTINYNHYIGRVFKDVDCVYDCDYNYETTIYFIYDTYIKNEPMFRYEVMYVQHDVIDIPSYEDIYDCGKFENTMKAKILLELLARNNFKIVTPKEYMKQSYLIRNWKEYIGDNW